MTQWSRWGSLALKLALVAVAINLAVTFYQRRTRPRLVREQPKRKIHLDHYTFLPKSYVTDFESAKKLVGKPLWVKECYRWIYEPGEETLGPLEKIVPTGVARRGGQVVLQFEKDGRRCRIPIGSGRRFYVDEIFLLKNPRELFDHWTEKDWARIEKHEVAVGESEYQVTFALGAGQLVSASARSATRIADYRLGEDLGIPPVRVTYRDGFVERVDPLP